MYILKRIKNWNLTEIYNYYCHKSKYNDCVKGFGKIII